VSWTARATPWLAAGLLAACHSAPDRSPDRAPAHDVLLARDSQDTTGRVPANATLESLLRQNNVSADLTASVITSVRRVFNPRDLRAGETYVFRRTLDGLLREFRYPIDPDRLLRVVFKAQPSSGQPAVDVDVDVVAVPRTIELAAVDASITKVHSSLVGAFDASGENVLLALALAEIFGGEVDFNSDLQPGDRIQVLFERVYREGQAPGYGDLKAAVLRTGGKEITAIPYRDRDGKIAWYDAEGRSLKRQFLKSPLPFEPRVTSRFSYRRVNPVHGDVRPHLGVDYGAPVGTAVMAVASGVVESAGWAGEAGRLIKLRHAGGYETEYLHLSAFAPGIRVGGRVEQGQLIGRVGMTGSATGPHLDYRILKNSTHVNPLVELSRMPPGVPIAADALPAFMQDRDAALGQLRERVDALAAASPAATPARPR
jgi:murein DD-endopeptidase MepM/ murein hydrolase activator NlpD